ncbi:MAG TPA: hypothetical protein VFP66_00545 [Candidatus Limnocylindrales bacterium]|nr:hypothetical protein [Candidatus Limnocylindrales bacterium]
MILQLWRELERQLESADEDDREDLHARIFELRGLYQRAIEDVYDVEAAGGPSEGGSRS